MRDSKYGPALVIHTLFTAGGYVLGFRVDPVDRLRNVYRELSSLYAVHGAAPIFGVFYTPPALSPSATTTQPVAQPSLRVDDHEEVDTSDAAASAAEVGTKIANYLADEQPDEAPQAPVYCAELGFAIEPIREGYTLADLWEVVPSAPTTAAGASMRK